jgi:hypothetical protein
VPDRMFAALFILGLVGVLPVVSVLAQAPQPSTTAPAGCEPGFAQRIYPHGSELNFRCRTRVIDCPEQPGHHAAVIPEPSFETAQGVQFGYRCQYTRRER